MPVRTVRTGAVAAGAASVLAFAALLVSVGWGEASHWARYHPVDPAPVSADGEARVRGLTLAFDGVEKVDVLPARYGEDVAAPDGWEIWVAAFEVSGAGADESASFSVEVSVIASDGATYTRSELIGYDAEPEEGWLGLFVRDGRQTDAVLLPEGVEPELVRVVPTDVPRDYWSFDV